MSKKYKSYGEKLRDPRWQKKRLEIMERDEWRCSRCLCDTRTLHVHHEGYKDGLEPWEYDEMDLMTLCDECHARRHGRTLRPDPVINIDITLADLLPETIVCVECHAVIDQSTGYGEGRGKYVCEKCMEPDPNVDYPPFGDK